MALHVQWLLYFKPQVLRGVLSAHRYKSEKLKRKNLRTDKQDNL